MGTHVMALTLWPPFGLHPQHFQPVLPNSPQHRCKLELLRDAMHDRVDFELRGCCLGKACFIFGNVLASLAGLRRTKIELLSVDSLLYGKSAQKLPRARLDFWP